MNGSIEIIAGIVRSSLEIPLSILACKESGYLPIAAGKMIRLLEPATQIDFTAHRT